MKKLLTLFTLLLCVCSGAWADDTYYLQTPGAATPMLTGDFYTTATLNQSQSCTYNDVNYTKAIKLGGGVASASGNNYPDRMIRYDCKTTQTDFTFVVYNSKTTAYKYYISSVKENTLGSANTVSEFTAYDASAAKGVYHNTTAYSVTCTSATRASVYFTVGNNSLYIVQIIATEKGENLLTPGSEGYSVNFNKGRIVARGGGDAVTLDGFLEFKLKDNYAAGNSSSAKITTNNTDYIKFAIATPMLLNFTTSSTTNYTVGEKGSTTNPYTPTANTAKKIKLTSAGTYYINPQGANVTPTGLSFSAAPQVTYNANGGSGTMSTTYFTVADNGFTAPDGQVFDGWKDSESNDYAVGAEVEADVTLYAQWRTPAVMHHVTYDLNGGTGEAPTQDDVEEEETFTVASADGLTGPDSKVFSCWSDGVKNYNPGDSYTMSTSDVTLTAQWAAPKCATPTITKGGFNFEHKGYEVTITNNEDESTLYYSTNNEDWTEYTSALYATTTTHYYAKSVKASYDDSEVADEIVTFTFDGGKKYIAWVYTDNYESKDDVNANYHFNNDPMVTALQTNYNVVAVNYAASATPSADLNNADLIVLTEAVSGSAAMTKAMKGFVGNVPMINMKFFAYTNADARWQWGTPANPGTATTKITPNSKLYKVLNGVTFDGDDISLYSQISSTKNANGIQTVEWLAEPVNFVSSNTDMAVTDSKVSMHAGTKFFGIGLSCDSRSYYNENAFTIIKNAAAMLIAGEDLSTEVASVPVTIGASGYASYCSSYALDFTETGVTAYTAKVEEEKVVLTKVTDNIVPANEGVVLRGAQNDYNIPVATTDDSFDFSENQMVGVVQRTLVEWTTGGKYNYILQQGQFNKATDGYLKANRAYLSTTYNVDAPGAKPLTIVFNDEEQGEETDGIKSVQGSGFTVNGEAYNLSGQRVGADYKGLVIINGKKVIRK